MLTVTDSGDDTPVWTDTIDGGTFSFALIPVINNIRAIFTLIKAL